MSEKITWTIANAENFVDFLKRFTKIDSNALIEFSTNNKIRSNCYTASKSSTKYGAIPIEDVFHIDEKNQLVEPIKMGIYNIEKFTSNLKNMVNDAEGTKDLLFTLEYSKDKDGELYGKRFIISDDNAEIEYPCAAKTLFRWLKDDILENVMNTTDKTFTFVLDPITLKKISNYSDAEVGTDLSMMPFLEDDGTTTILFKGRNFKRRWNLGAEVTDTNTKNYPKYASSIKKEFLKFLDADTYNICVTDTALILFSTQGEFKIVLAKLLDDDND